jgi:diguanylate cyclase (GGDEF)-like protein
LIIDTQAHVLLFNSAFDQMNGGRTAQLEGNPIMQLDWLAAGLGADAEAGNLPWDHVLRHNQTVQGKSLKVELPDGRSHELMMNCSAIDDSTGSPRGCLVTFNDVTPLSEANASLKVALLDLEASKSKIQEQNEELQKVAFNDPLTGCLNRRAFFNRAEALYRAAVDGGSSLICVMTDIDHFKSFNDKYGHAVGDLVIQQVANSLGRSLRSQDVLCRYGGEEFCILLVGLDLAGGVEIAERMRAKVEREAGPGVRSMEGLRVTASFGLSTLQTPATPSDDLGKSLQQLIELADQGLYVAKKQGRNRVASADGTILSAAPESLTR